MTRGVVWNKTVGDGRGPRNERRRRNDGSNDRRTPARPPACCLPAAAVGSDQIDTLTNTLCVLLLGNNGDIAPHYWHNLLIVATDHYRTISKITSIVERTSRYINHFIRASLKLKIYFILKTRHDILWTRLLCLCMCLCVFVCVTVLYLRPGIASWNHHL